MPHPTRSAVTWRRARALDEQLADGTDPVMSDELSLRAGQLGSARSRGRFACALRGAVELADMPFDPICMGRSVIRRAQVRENRELLLERLLVVVAEPRAVRLLARA